MAMATEQYPKQNESTVRLDALRMAVNSPSAHSCRDAIDIAQRYVDFIYNRQPKSE